MKKIYKEPKEIVIELGLQGQLLDTSVQGGYDEDGDKGGYGGSNEEVEMSRTSNKSLWDANW